MFDSFASTLTYSSAILSFFLIYVGSHCCCWFPLARAFPDSATKCSCSSCFPYVRFIAVRAGDFCASHRISGGCWFCLWSSCKFRGLWRLRRRHHLWRKSIMAEISGTATNIHSPVRQNFMLCNIIEEE